MSFFLACCSASDDVASTSNGNGREGIQFTYDELERATRKFTKVLGEGGLGKVYKGRLRSGQRIAVKKLTHDGEEGNRVFEWEMGMLSRLRHDNLVKLMGYCTTGQHRLLVLEYMPRGSLANILFRPKPGQEALDWRTRLRIDIGAARGREYLHCRASPPVIHWDLKFANILLDDRLNAKLADFGLAKFGPDRDMSQVRGYLDPDYVFSGCLTLNSDIYSFGVVLLELISGRTAIFRNTDGWQERLVDWAKCSLGKRLLYTNLLDPLLVCQFKTDMQLFNLRRVIGLVADCLKENPSERPVIRNVVATLVSAY